MQKLEGKKIVIINTLKSTYDNNTVEVTDDEGNRYRLTAEELLKIVSEYNWTVTKVRVHSYLSIEL